MANLSLRIIFGLLYVAIIIASTFFGTPYFELLMALCVFFSVKEMAQLSQNKTIQYVWAIPLLLCFSIILFTVFGAQKLDLSKLIVIWIIQLTSLFLGYTSLKKHSKINYVSTSIYLFLPLMALAIWFNQSQTNSFEYLLLYFITIWIYDSMAYVVGKKIGKKPVFPKVSPKKTIEGTIGGIILTVIIIFIIKKYLIEIPENVVIISLVVILFGIFGDFVESYMKRKLGIKDSGNLIPGHGGILDRMDSIYLSVLPYLILISLFR